MQLRPRTRRLAAVGIAASLMVTALSLPFASAIAHAGPADGAAQRGATVAVASVPAGGSDWTARRSVRPVRTGDRKLDAYCQAVADLINDSYADRDWAENAGDPIEALKFHQAAVEMQEGAESNGCTFTTRA